MKKLAILAAMSALSVNAYGAACSFVNPNVNTILARYGNVFAAPAKAVYTVSYVGAQRCTKIDYLLTYTYNGTGRVLVNTQCQEWDKPFWRTYNSRVNYGRRPSTSSIGNVWFCSKTPW